MSAKSSRVIGPNSVNGHLKNIATWASYTNAKRCTAHGKRGGGISTVCNFGVAPAICVQLGGHARIETTASYNKPNQAAFDQAIRAKHGSPTKIRKALEVHKQVESDNELSVDLQVDLDFSQSPSPEAAEIAASFSASPESPKSDVSITLGGTSAPDGKISNKFSDLASYSSNSTHGAAGCIGMMTQRCFDEEEEEMKLPSFQFHSQVRILVAFCNRH